MTGISQPLETVVQTVADGIKPYSAYKNSDIELLGEVPRHWKVMRLKHWVRINKETLPETTDPAYEFDYIDIGSVATGRLATNPERIQFATAPSRARRIVRAGDTIISTVRTYLKAVWHAKEPAPDLVASTGFAILTPNFETSPKFVSYVMQSDVFTNRVTAESIGIAYPAIPETKLNTFEIGIPPLPEQTAIVRYLDYVDRRVQQLTQTKRKLVALLTEQKQAVIHHAVTRGLDLNAPVRDSDIRWLKEVPAHWEVERTKIVFLRIVGGSTPSSNEPQYWGEDHVWVTPTDISRTTHIQDSQRRLTQAGLDSCSAELLPGGNIVISSRAPVGNVALVEVPFCTNQGCKALILRPEQISSSFALYLFKILKTELQNLANGTTFTEISSQNLGDVRIPLPPLPEQIAIVEYLDRATADIDAAIARANREIELLDEYRTRLIADVVTGKLDVREAAASLPEVDPLEMEKESL